VVLGRLDTGIVGLNPAEFMDVYVRLSVLCCPVYVEAFRRAEPPPFQEVLPSVKKQGSET